MRFLHLTTRHTNRQPSEVFWVNVSHIRSLHPMSWKTKDNNGTVTTHPGCRVVILGGGMNTTCDYIIAESFDSILQLIHQI